MRLVKYPNIKYAIGFLGGLGRDLAALVRRKNDLVALGAFSQ